MHNSPWSKNEDLPLEREYPNHRGILTFSCLSIRSLSWLHNCMPSLLGCRINFSSFTHNLFIGKRELCSNLFLIKEVFHQLGNTEMLYFCNVYFVSNSCICFHIYSVGARCWLTSKKFDKNLRSQKCIITRGLMKIRRWVVEVIVHIPDWKILLTLFYVPRNFYRGEPTLASKYIHCEVLVLTKSDFFKFSTHRTIWLMKIIASVLVSLSFPCYIIRSLNYTIRAQKFFGILLTRSEYLEEEVCIWNHLGSIWSKWK